MLSKIDLWKTLSFQEKYIVVSNSQNTNIHLDSRRACDRSKSPSTTNHEILSLHQGSISDGRDIQKFILEELSSNVYVLMHFLYEHFLK